MKRNNFPKTCHVCGGSMAQGKTTVTVDFGTGVVVLRNVPATVCSQCGEEWINDDIAAKIESIVEDAKEKRSELEVMSLSA